MKKIYLILLCLTFSLISYGQVSIVTIDRDNITGPTTTGTSTANISATGFTRGAGVTKGNGSDFNTKGQASANQTDAETGNKYIQWSVTANINSDVDINSLDIRLVRDNNGGQDWQIFYSLDGFATAGTSIAAAATVTTTETNYAISGLSINSGDGGTVTFRLYAWNANNNGGNFTIAGEPAWSDFGVTDPGVRISGVVNTTPVNNTESNIIATGFDPTDNINYSLYNVTTGLTTTNAIKIGEFIIQDGGDDLTDTDLLPTILTDMSFDISGFSNIAALGLFDGTTNLSETPFLASNTAFNNINSGSGISAPDNGSKTFSVYATFETLVTDNDQIQLTISTAVADGVNGSAFENGNAGGASTPIIGDDNRIEVTATQLEFGTQPTDISVLFTMSPAPTVLATDTNSNLDLDYVGTNTLSTSSSTFDPSATIALIAVSGVTTFDDLIFATVTNSTDLIAVSSTGLTFATSDTFEVTGLTVTIAYQDFDGGSPDWPYTTDIPFFDNGWGTDGYYGIIDSGIGTPLDYSSFSNNIIGTHDINDEGGGTAGLATITFSSVDISSFTNVSLTFDYDISGYAGADDAQYEVFLDGVGQGVVDLAPGAGDFEGSVNVVIPDITDAISLEVSVGMNGDTTFTGFDNFLISSIFDGLIYFSDSWSPSAPTNGTGGVNALIIDGTYTIGSDISLDTVIVEDLGTMVIDPGHSLQVTNDLFCNDNVILDSNSTGYSSLIVDGSVSGNVIYDRHVNINSGGNDLISAPVTGETFGVFATNPNNSNLLSNPSNLTQKRFGPFDKTVGLYLSYDTADSAEAAVTLDPGIGYRSASSDNGNLEFTGIVNNGDINTPIEISGPSFVQWNLIGNPYPSYIMLSSFLAVNNSQFDPITSGIYGYDGDASNGWEIWNQAYSDANPNAKITPGQGFLVSSVAASGTISFTTSMRINGNSDDFIAGRSSAPRISHVKLKLSSSNKNYSSDFYFTNNASLGFDPNYDSQIFGGSAPSFSMYSHLVNDNIGNDFAIQSLGYGDLNDVTVPLGINVNQGDEVTISISSSTLPILTNVYLEDNVENTLTLLTEGDYTFTPSTNIRSPGRFYLRFTSSALSIDKESFNDLQIYTTANPKFLHINGTLYDNTNLKIFDLQGHLVKSKQLELSSNNNQIDISNLSIGVYVVSLSNNSFTKTKKIIIK